MAKFVPLAQTQEDKVENITPGRIESISLPCCQLQNSSEKTSKKKNVVYRVAEVRFSPVLSENLRTSNLNFGPVPLPSRTSNQT
jgi:hypothetical protein